MRRGDGAPAPAKINLALVVGPRRRDGKHELATVYQKIGLADRVWVEPARDLRVLGFPEDTIVRHALELLAEAKAIEPCWHVYVEKHIPVAAGLGGGSSDAATALLWANGVGGQPLSSEELSGLAAEVGADAPFFLAEGPQLGTGDGTTLEPLRLPSFPTVLVLPSGVEKASTAAVYAAFDRRGGEQGFEERKRGLLATLRQLGRRRTADVLAGLPANDLASSPLAGRLRELGAFRADVSGAGPAVYALFEDAEHAEAAAADLRGAGRTWVVAGWGGEAFVTPWGTVA